VWELQEGKCTIDSNGCASSPHYPYGYLDNEECKILVTSAGKIRVDVFQVEDFWDWLEIQGTKYSGTTGPRDVEVAPGTIKWSSDEVNRQRGWKLCPAGFSAAPPEGPGGPPLAPTPAPPAPGPRLQWTVTKGPCSIDDNGCALSPNYPKLYGVSQHCKLDVTTSGSVSAESFHTEVLYDVLTFGGKQYSGNQGPSDVQVPLGVVMWFSDQSTVGNGWKLCPTEPAQEALLGTELSTAMAPSPGGDLQWEVTSGPCTIDSDGCAKSPHFPHNYGNNQMCKISVTTAGTIEVEDFRTEAGADTLEIQGVQYSGLAGPDGVAVAVGTLKWVSDDDQPDHGWMLCPAKKQGWQRRQGDVPMLR